MELLLPDFQAEQAPDLAAKLRLGWDSTDEIHENAAMAAEGGATWVTVHARTRCQGYAPPVDWPIVGRRSSPRDPCDAPSGRPLDSRGGTYSAKRASFVHMQSCSSARLLLECENGAERLAKENVLAARCRKHRPQLGVSERTEK